MHITGHNTRALKLSQGKNCLNINFFCQETPCNLNAFKVQHFDISNLETYRALTCFRQFLSPFRPPLMHSICLFVFPLKWKERKIPCCLAGHGQKGVRGGL